MIDFSGKTVMITGAAGGIGRAMTRLFYDLGAKISALDRDEGVLSLRRDLELEDGKFTCAVVDITDGQGVRRSVETFRRTMGSIDVLINNAGFSGASNLETTDADSWKNDIAINLNGAYHCTSAVLEHMKRQQGGAIVNIGSVNGFTTLGDPAYSAAKAGLMSYTKAVAMEYGRFGIRANMVSPGTVRTPIWDHRIARDPEIFDNLLQYYPLRRIAMPEDIANAAAFLASSLANSVSGAILPVDCGLMAGNIVMSRDVTMLEF